ncbi:MAG: hypothetical protein C4327_15065 [Meiothermus sp.]
MEDEGSYRKAARALGMSTLADKLRQFRAELAALRQNETAAEARSQVAEVRAALRERFKAVRQAVN